MMKKFAFASFLLLTIMGLGYGSSPEGIPDIAAALSSQNYQAELRALAATEHPVQRFVLPAVEIMLGGPLETSSVQESLKLVRELFPAAAQVWLRLKLVPPAAAVPDQELEDLVNRWPEALIGQVGLDFSGVVLEMDKSCPEGLAGLVISSLSVSLKAKRRELQMAVPSGIAAAIGPKLAMHVDRYTFGLAEAWRPTMERLAEQKMLRPSLMFWEGDGRLPGPEAYLDGVLAALKFQPDLFVFPAERLEDVEGLQSLQRTLRSKVPETLPLLIDDVPLFHIARQDGVRPPQAVYVDESFDSVFILAKLDASDTSPFQGRFVSGSGEPYDITGFDPLAAVPHKGKTLGTENVAWTAKYILLQAARSSSADMRFRKSIDVNAKMSLTVAEIIARWQQYDGRQKLLLQNYVSKTEMDLHFQPPGLGSGFDVGLHFNFFWKSDGSQYWEQTEQYLNGIRLSTKQMFPLPMLEPDKIVVRPLELKLVESYVYTLEGTETIQGSECYVISYKPRTESKEALYSGRIWIDTDSFRRARMLLVQNNATGSITSNTELQHFDRVAGPDGSRVEVLVRNDVKQKVLAAGREFLLERQYRFKDFRVNIRDFDASLQAAFGGEKPMLAETASGLRELAKDKTGGRKVVDKVKTSVGSLITGIIYDGSFSFPIPMLGLSAIDGNFLKSGGQLSTFWAGPIVALNYSKTSKSNLTWGGDLFLSALPRSDRLFRKGVEAETESVYLFTESLGARLRWQPLADFSLTASAYLSYELFLPQKQTSDDFVRPRNGFTANQNLSFEYSHGGYLADLGVSLYERLGWRSWGLPELQEDVKRSYQYGYAKLGKQFYLNSFTRLGAELAYYAGRNLDRFSSFQPSMFSTPKVRGIPSGTISLNKIGTAGLNLGFTIFDLIRFDTYYSYAQCYEQSPDGGQFGFHGLEIDFGTIGPWRSYIQGVVSVALRGLPSRYTSRWSIYLLMFIPFN